MVAKETDHTEYGYLALRVVWNWTVLFLFLFVPFFPSQWNTAEGTSAGTEDW